MLNVLNVIKRSPAYKAGIRGGDTILKINSQSCSDFIDYEYLTSGSSFNIIFKNKKGKIIEKNIKKDENEDFGIEI